MMNKGKKMERSDWAIEAPRHHWREVLAGGQVRQRQGISMATVLTAAMLAACTPTVKVEAPKEPIVINMNINISHEIRVKVDKDLENLLEKKDDIF
jgi:hypothetical protein